MPQLLLYLVIAIFAWMGFALFGASGNTTLTPGLILIMAGLSVLIWDRVVAPMMHRAAARKANVRTPHPAHLDAARPAAPAQRRQVQTPPHPATPSWRPLSA